MTLLRRWIARAGDGTTVRELLDRAGADARAIAEGRVFLGRKRVRRDNEPVSEGDILELAPTHPESIPAAPPRVLVCAEDLVAVDKPAGIPTIGDHAGEQHALVSLVAALLKLDVARIHPTSRLDRNVSGVVFFALTRGAAARLAQARASGAYDRRYVAIATRPPEPACGTWDWPLGRGQSPRVRAVSGRRALPSRTSYGLCGRSSSGPAMLACAPVTGRTHQIRLHAAHAGVPLLGDRTYGGPARIVLLGGRVVELKRIALHALRVVVPNRLGLPIAAVAPVPSELEDLWGALGGPSGSWDAAAACVFPACS